MPALSKSKIAKPKTLNPRARFSKVQILSFVAVFTIIGGVFIYRSFAASPVVIASIEGEQMSQPAGIFAVTNPNASSGKSLYIPINGTVTGSVSFSRPVSSFNLVARGIQCQGSPAITVMLDNRVVLSNMSLSNTSYSEFTYNFPSNVSQGTHSYSINFANDFTRTYKRSKNSGKIVCSRAVYVDNTKFFGSTTPPTPTPTVSLSATPTSVTAGSASTLTWNSTDATSCTASGSWSGNQPTSGSATTGALNQNSTYSLSCTGSGGVASTSVNVIASSFGGTGTEWSYAVASPQNPGTTISNMSGLGINVTTKQDIADKVIDGTGDTGVLFQSNGTGSSMSRIKMSRVAAGNSVAYGKHGVYGKVSNLSLQDMDISCSSYCASGISFRYDGATLNRFKVSGAPHAITYYETSTTPGVVTIKNGSGSFTSDTAIWVDAETDYTQKVIQKFVITNVSFNGNGAFMKVASARFASPSVVVQHCFLNGKPVTAADFPGVSNLTILP